MCKEKNLYATYTGSSLIGIKGVPIWTSKNRNNVELRLSETLQGERQMNSNVLTGAITNLREVQISCQLGNKVRIYEH